nr:sentrin-specific protease 7-like [Bactrocera oleae]
MEEEKVKLPRTQALEAASTTGTRSACSARADAMHAASRHLKLIHVATPTFEANANTANVSKAVNTTTQLTDHKPTTSKIERRTTQAAMRRSIADHVATTPCIVGRIVVQEISEPNHEEAHGSPTSGRTPNDSSKASNDTSSSDDATVPRQSPVIELSSDQENTEPERDRVELTFPPGQGGVSLYRADLLSLEDGSWLTDTVIDAWAKHLETEFGPRGTILSPFVVWQLNQHGGREENFRRIHRWIRNIDIFGQRVVLAPHNIAHHWYVLALSNRELTHHITDTVCCQPHQLWTADSWTRGKVTHATTAWREFLQWEYKERYGQGKFDFRELLLEVPQQENTDDCGIYVLETMKRVMRYVGRGEGAPGCISEPFTAEMAAKKRAHMLATFRHHQDAKTARRHKNAH